MLFPTERKLVPCHSQPVAVPSENVNHIESNTVGNSESETTPNLQQPSEEKKKRTFQGIALNSSETVYKEPRANYDYIKRHFNDWIKAIIRQLTLGRLRQWWNGHPTLMFILHLCKEFLTRGGLLSKLRALPRRKNHQEKSMQFATSPGEGLN